MNCDSTAQSINKFKEVMEFVQEQSKNYLIQSNILVMSGRTRRIC